MRESERSRCFASYYLYARKVVQDELDDCFDSFRRVDTNALASFFDVDLAPGGARLGNPYHWIHSCDDMRVRLARFGLLDPDALLDVAPRLPSRLNLSNYGFLGGVGGD